MNAGVPEIRAAGTRNGPAIKAFGPGGLAALALCAAGSAAAFFFFWRDFNQTLTRLNEAPIAEVTWKQKNAQRRFADRVLWDRLRMTSPVYDEDLVRTAELSEAVIAFTESPYLIVVHENTLLHITAPQKDTDPDGPLDREAPVRIYEGSAELWREGESVILDAAAAGASLPHASGVSYHHGPCHRPKRLHLHPGRIPSFL